MRNMRLCLNMIVKDEAHIIEETLEHLKKYISYWVISDTGSTDNTKEIIKNFFEKNKIPGKLVEHVWEDFGSNRTLALDACYPLRENFDYIWVFDADDLIVGDIKFPKIVRGKPNKNPDFYTLKYGSGFTYMRNQVFKSTEKWCYVGVLHEYPKCKTKEKLKNEKIEGDYYIDSRRLGARSKASDKYLRDAMILEKGLVKEPNNERYMFYLGQSYLDSGKYEKSIYWYQKRIDMGRWYEEVYYSYYQIAKCKRELKKPWKEIEKAFMDAWKFLPSRAEPLYEIAKYYRIQNIFEQGYKYAKLASKIPFPKDQLLFIFKSVYDYQVMDELSICESYIGKYQECVDTCNKLLKICPKEHYERIKNNRMFSFKKLEEIGYKKKIIFYVGYSIFEESQIYGSELACINLCKEFSKKYDVYVFGKSLHNNIIENIPFINSSKIEEFINNNEIEALIISRYIHYFLEYPILYNKTYIWLHDVCFHGAYNGKSLPNNGKQLVNNMINNISKIITLSSWHKDLICKTYNLNEDKVSIIGNGINENIFKDYQNFNEIVKQKISYRFIYTSDVCRGLEQLVDYFIDIRKEFPLSELYIYRGLNSFDNYPNLLNKIKNIDFIHYEGKLEQKELMKKFIISDIWLYPTSFNETYCMSGLEALRSGCYCISTNLAALKNTIGDRGILIEGDPKDLNVKKSFLEEVRKAFLNEKIKKEMQEKAFNWAKEYTWNKISEEWLKIIE